MSVAGGLVACANSVTVNVVSAILVSELTTTVVTTVLSGRFSVFTDVDEDDGRSSKGMGIVLVASSSGAAGDNGRCVRGDMKCPWA
jgi:hypothetical protein